MTIEEAMVDTDALEWKPLTDGIDVKLLFSSAETGRWTVLLKCAKGSFFARHKHYGPGEYYVIKGRMEYRMGMAKTGDYGYEPLGSVHDMTTFPEDTLLHFTNYGPVLFLGEDDQVEGILDSSFFENLCGS
ncbi:MAG: 2,4'-dihydroxyacetophenone dioxygenase family protein [Pseudomonadota bacterium]